MRRQALVLLMFILLITLGCVSGKKDIDMPQDFNFIMKYGIGAKNVLDTAGGTFTKDLISAGTKTTELSLTEKELQGIYSEMDRINILNYPEKFSPKSDVFMTPHPTYYLKIQVNSEVKEILWEDKNDSQAVEAVQLRNLVNRIVQSIEKKKEFKTLPGAVGGYI